MKKELLLILFSMVLLLGSAFAQQITLSGKVSTPDGPAVGASITVKGNSIATKTNEQGIFAIKVSKTDVLHVSYVGYKAADQAVGNNTSLNFNLQAEEGNLDEVVVTAYGIKRSNRDLGYDAQTVKGSELAATQRDNFINSLQGRVAGATITSTSGTPGASTSIIIRGAVSLDGDNQPLFVVDGLPISNNTFSEYGLVAQGTLNRTNDYGNRGMDINPEEIETLTILKGPEATALYGTQGASGAVVITTKRAKAGTASVTYNNSFRAETPYRFPEIQTVYGGGAGGIFDEELRTRTYFGAKYPNQYPLYDNLGAFYKTGWTQKHNASVEGGTDKLSMRFALGYTGQNGVIKGTDYSTINAKLSATSKISSKISMNASLNFISSKTDKSYKGNNSPMLSVLTWPVIDDIRNDYTPTGDRRTITGSYGGELDNPLWAMENNPNWDKVNRVITNLGFNYKPLSWWGFQGTVGADVYALQGLNAYHPQSYNANAVGTTSSGGGINTFNENASLFNGSLVSTMSKTFGKFKPSLVIGYDISNNRDEINSQFGTKFYQQKFYSLNNTDPTTQRVAYQNVLKRKMGAFAQATFGYDDLLFLTVTGREDFSSTLPINEYTFFYPAASLSFVFSDLPVFKSMKWLTSGKLRGSWGQAGKDPRKAYITKTSLIAQGTTGGGFATDVTLGNPNLKAEFTTSKEIGLDLSFFGNRLSTNFSYYNIVSNGQITAPRLSYATGAVLEYINSGQVINKGFEWVIKGTPIRTKDFTWDITANITRIKGKITALPANQQTFYVSDTWLFDNIRRQYVVGSSVSALASQEYLRNKNGDILINPTNGMPIKDTNWTQIGDTAPDFGVGLVNSITYKNFNLSFLFDIRKGGDVYNATELYLYSRGMSTKSLDRETPRIVKGVMKDGLENTSNPTPNNIAVLPYISTSYYSTYYNTLDFLEKDINWIRLKDITLTYNLPKTVFSNSKTFKSASVFFTGTDLWLITNYSGVDPSVNGLNAASGGTGGTGIDFGTFGQPMGFNFGLRVSF